MRKKIAFISDHASPLAILGGVDSGGQNVYVAELARQLVERNYEVDIFTRKDDASLPEVVNWEPFIRVVHVTAGPQAFVAKEKLLQYMPDFTYNMLRFIQKEQVEYSLIHANFFMSAWVASRIRKVLHIPYVITFHALGLVRKVYQKEMDQFPEERLSIERFLVQDADALIAECPQDKEDLIHYYGASASRIKVVPCGFSCREFEPVDKTEARRLLKLPENEKIVLQLGRMVPRKGVDNVIRSIGRLKHSLHNIKLVIVGGESDIPDPAQTPEMRRLQRIAEEEGVLSSVIFAGRKSREVLKYYYAAADVFITTPWYEPFGITPLEAMACGTPVIGSAVGGIKYSVKDGQTGFLVPPNDPDALAERLGVLLTDQKLLHMMQKNALARVNKLFTWDKVAQKMDDLYEVTCKAACRVQKKTARPVLQKSFVFNDIGTLFRETFYPALNIPR